MRRDLQGALRVLFLPTLALGVVAGLVPGRLPVAVRVYALVVCAVALAIALLALRRAYPPAPPLRRKTPRESERRRPPATLARTETFRYVAHGAGTAEEQQAVAEAVAKQLRPKDKGQFWAYADHARTPGSPGGGAAR